MLDPAAEKADNNVDGGRHPPAAPTPTAALASVLASLWAALPMEAQDILTKQVQQGSVAVALTC
jgi:hypothetical protein